MITYLIKSGGCLLILLTVYYLLLEKEKSLRFNRVWLLFSLLFSFVVPFLPLSPDGLPAPGMPSLPKFSLPVNVQGSAIAPVFSDTAHAMPTAVSGVVILYCLITAFWFLRFSRNLYLILHRIASHPQVRAEGARLVLLTDDYVPHTFGRAIFLNQKAWDEGTIDQEVLTHELAHARQLHTLDILLLEVLRIFFWFNPMLILYKRAMQLNHEFLADEAVIETFQNPKQYQELLFQLAGLANPSSLSSPLNFHITKKRLMMITRNASKNSWIKKLFTVLLLAGVIIIFGTSTHAQKTASKNVQLTDSVVYTDRMVMGTENLGAHPYVLIDNKPYPSDILTRINPGCIAATSIWGAGKAAEQKYGAVAADGVVDITLNKQGLTYATAIQKENLALKRAAKNGFYYRVRQKHDDGTPYDEFVVNMANGQATEEGKPGSRVAFVVEDKLYQEGQLDEVQARLKIMKIGISGVGKVPKPVPGADLSRYDVVFFFYSALGN